MGDVVHNLPLVADIRRHDPHAEIDWVVEESFAGIPVLNPHVRKVIPVATRRWRKTWFTRRASGELRAFRSQLQSERYDYVLDTQGLLKSALIARVARGRRCGYSAGSARERFAARFYDATFDVPRDMHAVERNRTLAALAFQYQIPNDIDCGLSVQPMQPGHAYAVLLHGTSRADKEWDAESWVALGQFLNAQEIEVLLPWGSEAERARSKGVEQKLARAFVPGRMPLAKLARLLAGAAIVIGADTGLTHLAAALGQTTLGIYCASDPRLTGLYGSPKAINVGGVARPPGAREVIAAVERLLA